MKIKIRYCAICNKAIKAIIPEHHDEEKPEEGMWGGGIVDKIAAGYGSKLDGSMYIISICDECIESNADKIEYVGDYMQLTT